MTTTHTHHHVVDWRRSVDVEVGDAKQEGFFPQLKTLHWDNECNFSIRFLDESPGSGAHSVSDGVVRWEKGNHTCRWYPIDRLPDGHEHAHLYEDGGHEFEVELARRPSTNILRFSVQSKGLVFTYQPALTPEQVANGDVRPEPVVGSYAVYHEEKRNNTAIRHYATGKAFHIMRPHAVDADGRETWCDLALPEGGNGIATITVPQGFLDEASYPVVVDPTIGYTTIGGSSGTSNLSDFNSAASLVSSAAGPGTVKSFSLYASTATTVEFALYTLSGTTVGTRLAATQTLALSATASWQTTANVTQSMSNGTTYCVAVGVPGTSTVNVNFDTSGATSLRHDFTNNGLAATYSNDGSSTNQVSLYANYIPTSTIAFVAERYTNSVAAGSPFTFSPASNTTAGSLVVLLALTGGATAPGAFTALSDNAGNTWSRIVGIASGNVGVMAGYSFTTNSITTSSTISASWAVGQFRTLLLEEFSGPNVYDSALLATTSGTGNTTSINTPAANGYLPELVISLSGIALTSRLFSKDTNYLLFPFGTFDIFPQYQIYDPTGFSSSTTINGSFSGSTQAFRTMLIGFGIQSTTLPPTRDEFPILQAVNRASFF